MRFLSRFLAYFTAILSFALGSPASAQNTYFWNYAGTDWSTSANWSPNGVPSTTDTAILGAFDGPTYNVPAFSANAAAGQLAILGPGTGALTEFLGNGNTLTLGTGGTMSASPLTYRGSFGTTVILDNEIVNIANGTTFAAGANQTIGAVSLSGFASRFELESGSQLRLVNTAGTASYDLTINGGAQVRVNAGTTITNGVGTTSPQNGQIRFHGGGFGGGGALVVQGSNGAANTFNLNQIAAASGHGRVGIFAGSTSGSSVTLNLGNGTAQSGLDRHPRAAATGSALWLGSGTLEFEFNGAIPGFTGSTGRLFLAPGLTGIPQQHGVITTGTSNNSNSPYAILTGQVQGASGSTGRFATWNSTTHEVTAQLGTILTQTNLSTVSANSNVIYRPTGNGTLANSITLQTIVFESSASGRTLDLNGFTMTTPGIIAGQTSGSADHRFAINNGTIAGSASSLTNIFVLGSRNFLDVGATFTAAGVVKSGAGTMVLTGNTPQLNNVLDVYINLGAIRARIDGVNANLGTLNSLNLRGGVLEVDANGGTSAFTRSLGNDFGQVNWTYGPGVQSSDRGSGGFAVVNGNLDVNIGGDERTLVWNGTSGGNEFFLRSGQTLHLNSFRSTGITTLVNDLALDDGTAGLPPESRQIHVGPGIGQPGISADPAFRSRITGVISGSASTGLMKIGPGMLELSNANTYAGGTSIDVGTLLVSNTSGSATGTGRVVVFDALMGNGIIAPSDGKGLTMMENSFLGLYRDRLLGTPGHLTVGSAGVNNPVTLRGASASTIAQLNGTTFNPNGGSTSHSRLTVKGTGKIDVTGNNLVVALNTGFTPSGSDVFGILDNQTGNAITGTFAGIAEGGTVNAVFVNNAPAGTFLLTYQGNITESGISISGGNDVVLYSFTPVPEPAAVLGMCGVAVSVVGAVRRVRRRVSAVV